MRFSSTLFYNARVSTSSKAEFYRLSYEERKIKYPQSTLRFLSTSELPLAVRKEQLTFNGNRPGLENPTEAQLTIQVLFQLLQKYPINEITIISPYRRQVRLVRSKLSYEKAKDQFSPHSLSRAEWEQFLHDRISTVDRFQGGESDAVIISYVRSNIDEGIGFVDDPHRINVAHTRCRKELVVIGDLECLKAQSTNSVFQRMQRAIQRDGELVMVTTDLLSNQYFKNSVSNPNERLSY